MKSMQGSDTHCLENPLVSWGTGELYTNEYQDGKVSLNVKKVLRYSVCIFTSESVIKTPITLSALGARFLLFSSTARSSKLRSRRVDSSEGYTKEKYSSSKLREEGLIRREYIGHMLITKYVLKAVQSKRCAI